MTKEKIKLRPGIMIAAILIPMLVGITSAMISSDGMKAYSTMTKPPLSPPAWMFSVAWTILYIVMGVASYFVFVSDKRPELRKKALCLYAIQLVLNFFWSIIFFVWKQYLFAFIELLMLLMVVAICMLYFIRIQKISGLMMIPYVAWLCFAGYLNLMSYMMN